MYAFLRLGFRDEADRFMHWIHTHVTTHASETEPLPPLFTIHGDDHTPEIVLSELQGYAKSAPVRVGNAAVGQFQVSWRVIRACNAHCGTTASRLATAGQHPAE